MKLYKVFGTPFFKNLLGSFQWYRRWYGGRWERHCTEDGQVTLWLSRTHDRKWPEYPIFGSHGTPLIEDYPVRCVLIERRKKPRP